MINREPNLLPIEALNVLLIYVARCLPVLLLNFIAVVVLNIF